jgi:hypothetical protein
VPILGANAVLSYSYLKDVIVSPAGVFHAVAATVAFTCVLERLAVRTPARRPAVVVLTLMLFVLTAAWTTRLVGLHFSLRQKAFIVRNDWMWMGPEPTTLGLENNPEGARLVRDMYAEVARMRVAAPHFLSRTAWRYFETPW